MGSKANKARVIVLGAIGGVIGHVLMIKTHTPNSMYYFPGGAVEEGESFIEAASRELHEELGIFINPANLEQVSPRFVGKYIDMEPEHRRGYNEKYYYVVVDMLRTIPTNTDKEGEVAHFMWADINKAMVLLYPRYALMLDDVLAKFRANLLL